MKNTVCTVVGTIGAFISGLFGGWTAAMTTLLIFMTIDFVSGLVAAGVFHKSRKTESGTLRSKEGFKGLYKKCMILLFILIAYRLDLAIGSIFVELSCATATYYWKTKNENRIKITIGAIKEILDLGELDESKTRIIEALINTLG